jgi:hypothetical protein
MSPHVDRVLPLVQKRKPATIEEMGRLDNLDDECRREMTSADVFLDAWGAGFFLRESHLLDVPFYEILARRPELELPEAARSAARRRLAPWSGASLVGLNLAKYGAACLLAAAEPLRYFVDELLRDPNVVVLNILATRFDFSHWPDHERNIRQQAGEEEARILEAITGWHDRIVEIRDEPLAEVAAILEQCGYFAGVDNGIKHLAWALDIPRTLFSPGMPDGSFLLRWMPDFHRILLFNAPVEQFNAHLDAARAALSNANTVAP